MWHALGSVEFSLPFIIGMKILSDLENVCQSKVRMKRICFRREQDIV